MQSECHVQLWKTSARLFLQVFQKIIDVNDSNTSYSCTATKSNAHATMDRKNQMI